MPNNKQYCNREAVLGVTFKHRTNIRISDPVSSCESRQLLFPLSKKHSVIVYASNPHKHLQLAANVQNQESSF